MEYPLISEYIDAILSAEDNMATLNNLRPVLDDRGRPVMSSGNFAVVFKMRSVDSGRCYAVKCFIKDQEGRAEAYQQISQELEFVSSPYILHVQYLENELFVDTTQTGQEEFPVLKMEWVEGKPLDAYLRENIYDNYALEMLTYRFCRMGAFLHSQPFAHGDLKPDNILVRENGELVLVDYDGMFVPSMEGQKARELGSPDFRHPLRDENQFDSHIDDFAIASIALSLKSIALDPSMLVKYGATDRLLFSAEDYRNLGESNVLKAVTSLSSDSALASLFSAFLLASAKNSLASLSYRIFLLPEPEMEILSAEITEIELKEAVTDEYGALYTKDWKKLISGPDVYSYTIKEGTVVIGNNAFDSFESIDSISIPPTVHIIGKNAFRDCFCLQSITIPNSVTNIGMAAFSGCVRLTSIKIPNGIKSIDKCMFMNCRCLVSIDVPNSINCIGDFAFWHCSNLVSINIPDCTTYIGNYAFAHCWSLKTITLPKCITFIGSDAFEDCQSLWRIYIPYSTKHEFEKILPGHEDKLVDDKTNNAYDMWKYEMSNRRNIVVKQ